MCLSDILKVASSVLQTELKAKLIDPVWQLALVWRWNTKREVGAQKYQTYSKGPPLSQWIKVCH